MHCSYLPGIKKRTSHHIILCGHADKANTELALNMREMDALAKPDNRTEGTQDDHVTIQPAQRACSHIAQ